MKPKFFVPSLVFGLMYYSTFGAISFKLEGIAGLIYIWISILIGAIIGTLVVRRLAREEGL